MTSLFQTLHNVLTQGRAAVLATVISSKGSLPMSERAKMLVFQDGSISGTVGGGIVEASVIEEALTLFESRAPTVLDFDLSSDLAEDEGLTCGGRVGIFLEYFSPEDTLDLVQELAQVYSGSNNAVVATMLPSAQIEPGAFREIGKLILTKNGTLRGTSGDEALDRTLRETLSLYLEQPVLKILDLELSAGESPHLGKTSGTTLKVFVETILPAPTAYLFGGGHVSQHLATILHFIGFDYLVIDDRQDFLSRELFPHARDFVFCDFTRALEELTPNASSSYFVIVTRGHKSDLVVLRQALQRELKYIGMIGSKRKVKLLLGELQKEGVAPEKLEQIHTPIGLPIGADTPEEIAISIAAELIQIRRAEGK